MQRDTSAMQLIETVRGGDLAAYDRLAALYEDDLRRTVVRQLRHHGLAGEDSEEILQETLVRALQALERFRWSGEAAFLRWLSGISRRVVLALRRERARVDALAHPSAVSARDPSPSRTLGREERFHRLQEALRGLSDEHREVILLARIEGLTSLEIAERTGRSAEAVRQLLRRAIKSLGARFSETGSLSLPARPLGFAETIDTVPKDIEASNTAGRDIATSDTKGDRRRE